jgi:hypothetical protein
MMQGLDGEVERPRHLLGRLPFGNELQDMPLTGRERINGKSVRARYASTTMRETPGLR